MAPLPGCSSYGCAAVIPERPAPHGCKLVGPGAFENIGAPARVQLTARAPRSDARGMDRAHGSEREKDEAEQAREAGKKCALRLCGQLSQWRNFVLISKDFRAPIGIVTAQARWGETMDERLMADFACLDPIYVDGTAGAMNLGETFATLYFRWVAVRSTDGGMTYERAPALYLVRPKSVITCAAACPTRHWLNAALPPPGRLESEGLH